MAKILINFTVEEHIVAAFKSVIPTRERSRVIENFMESISRLEAPDKEEEELLEEISLLRDDLHERSNTLNQKCAQLELIRTNKVKQEKELEERERLIRQMDDQSGILRDLPMD